MIKGLKETFGVAGLGVGLGIAGDAFDSEGLKSAGNTASSFVSPMVSISMGGFLIKNIKDLGKI